MVYSQIHYQNRGIPSFVKKLIMGIVIAAFAGFFLKGNQLGQLVLLIGLAIAGFSGTIVVLFTPPLGVLSNITVGFLF